jgi:hypothetical protein
MKIKDKILSKTSEETKKKVRDIANKLVMKQETLEEHNYLQGFINQFEEEGKHQELSNYDWTVSRFLKWMKLNNFKIIRYESNIRI